MEPEMGTTEPKAGTATQGEIAAHISREMVKLMRKIAGRGPTRARTTIARDHVLVMFQETLTDGERTLVENGLTDEVHAVRAAYQKMLRDDAVALIEGALDRKVIGFMSNNHFDPDLGAELFVLDPAEESVTPVPQEAEHEAIHNGAVAEASLRSTGQSGLRPDASLAETGSSSTPPRR